MQVDYGYIGDDCMFEPPAGGSGFASTLPVSEITDAVKQLHEVVFEVTGRAVEVKAQPRMGFL